MFSRLARLFSALYLLLAPALRADQVLLTNGDIITGSVVKKDGATLTLKSDVLGVVSMPWSAVKSLKSEEKLTVVLPGGETVTGTVATTGDALQVAAGAATRSAPLKEVSVLRNAAEQRAWERLQSPGWGQLWAGFFDLGLALARGNARTDTLTTSFNASRITSTDKTAAYFSQIRGTARVKGESSTIASAVRGGWSYNRNVSSRLFVSTLNEYEHDRFQDLNLRFVAGGGFGLHAVKTDTLRLDLNGGLNYSRENFTHDLRRNSAEANFGNDLSYKLSTITTLTQSFRIFPNLTDTGEYRAALDLSTATALSKWLAWQVTASDRFQSNPVLGRQRNDLVLSTGFRLSFAR